MALPRLGGSIKGVATSKIRSLGSSIAGPATMKHAVLDNMPLFDFVSGIGSLLGGIGPIDDDDSAIGKREEEPSQTTFLQAIANELQLQTGLMHTDLNLSRLLLKEAKGDKFKEIEKERERLRAQRLEQARLRRQQGGGPPSAVRQLIPETMEEGWGFIAKVGFTSLVYAIAAAFVEGVWKGLPKTITGYDPKKMERIPIRERSNVAGNVRERPISAMRQAFPTFAPMMERYTTWRNTQIANWQKISNALHRGERFGGRDLPRTFKDLPSIFQQYTKMRVGIFDFMESLRNSAQSMRGFLRATLLLPVSLADYQTRMNDVLNSINRQANQARGGWDRFMSFITTRLSNTAARQNRTELRQIRRFREAIRTSMGLLANITSLPVRWFFQVVSGLQNAARGLGRLVGRFFKIWIAFETWWATRDEFAESESHLSALLAGIKKFVELWYIALLDLAFDALPWMVEQFARAFKFKDVADRIKAFRSEFDFGSLLMSMLTNVVSNFWNLLALVLNSIPAAFNSTIGKLLPDNWKWAYVPYMDESGSIIQEGEGAYNFPEGTKKGFEKAMENPDAYYRTLDTFGDRFAAAYEKILIEGLARPAERTPGQEQSPVIINNNTPARPPVVLSPDVSSREISIDLGGAIGTVTYARE